MTVIPKAVGAESGKIVTFTYLGAGSREANSGEIHVETLTIDDLVESQQLPSVEFVKMDVEGAETRALAGAARTIRRSDAAISPEARHFGLP